MRYLVTLSVVLSILLINTTFSGTTGKIVGTLSDARTGEKLASANVVIEGQNIGTTTNVDGYYVILNVAPGVYKLKASLLGYASSSGVGVRVDIDQTTRIDFKLTEESVTTDEVVVVATRPIVQRDVSASRANIQIQDVEKLPVVSVVSAVTLQAGIQSGLSVRGSGADQTAFIVDGQTLRDERNNTPYTGISLSAVQDIQVQTGGFNAEYGNIRAGVVNVVTKDGDKNLYSISVTGRYSPATPKHFGPSIYDRNSYWIRPYVDEAVAWTGTKNGAWDAYTQRQYPEFSGWNAIAAATLKDNNPNNDLTPLAAQRLFLWEHRKQAEISEPDFDIDMGFGGPVPGVSPYLGDLRFFASYRRSQSAYLIPLSRLAYKDYNGQLKLTADITGSMKLSISGSLGRSTGTSDNNAGLPGVFTSAGSMASQLTQPLNYIDGRIFGSDYWAPNITDYQMLGAKISHVVGPRTFYDASVHWFKTAYDTNPDRERDTTKRYLFGNAYLADEAPFGWQQLTSNGITGMRMGVGMSNSRDSSKVYNITAKFDITSQLDQINQVKAGFEFVYTDNRVNYRSVDIVLPSTRTASVWNTFPKRGGLYLQDKLEFEGMVANLGVRLDYLDPASDWYVYKPFDDAFSSAKALGLDTLLARERTERQVTISPRIGVAFPITEDAKLFFNYGHFRSLPAPENLYLLRRFTENNAVVRLANPNNALPKTVAYELGYEHSIVEQFLIRVAAYYKDVSSEPRLVQYTNRNGSVNYAVSTANQYRDIRGFELTASRNKGEWVQGFINYTYDVRTSGYFGYAQYYQNPTDQARYILNNVYQEKPIPQPYARANIDFYTPPDFGPALGSFHFLGDLRLNLVGTWNSGFYFTWTGGSSIPGIENNVQWKDSWNVDMRLSKTFSFAGANVQLFMDVTNLFNMKYMTLYGFVDTQDYLNYMKSLHLPGEIGDQLGYGNIAGSDRPGDYRTVPYEPYDPNDPDEARRQRMLDTKAYIDMPNQETFTFLNPRDIFYGIKLSIDLK